MYKRQFQIRAYGFFVSESLVFVVIHVVGYFAGFGHFAYLYLDGGYALDVYKRQR